MAALNNSTKRIKNIIPVKTVRHYRTINPLCTVLYVLCINFIMTFWVYHMEKSIRFPTMKYPFFCLLSLFKYISIPLNSKLPLRYHFTSKLPLRYINTCFQFRKFCVIKNYATPFEFNVNICENVVYNKIIDY